MLRALPLKISLCPHFPSVLSPQALRTVCADSQNQNLRSLRPSVSRGLPLPPFFFARSSCSPLVLTCAARQAYADSFEPFAKRLASSTIVLIAKALLYYAP